MVICEKKLPWTRNDVCLTPLNLQRFLAKSFLFNWIWWKQLGKLKWVRNSRVFSCNSSSKNLIRLINAPLQGLQTSHIPLLFIHIVSREPSPCRNAATSSTGISVEMRTLVSSGSDNKNNRIRIIFSSEFTNLWIHFPRAHKAESVDRSWVT